MSQSGGYQYQPYSEPPGSLKATPPPMVNGQPSVTPHVQNGVQSPHFNPPGTPSSQSSRDPSREPSRDPSPTQYLHNQYRPQLSRPPMPPINGQQTPTRNTGILPPRMGQMQNYSPTATPPPNANNQPIIGTPVSNVTSSGMPVGLPPTFRPQYPTAQSLKQGLGSQTVSPPSQFLPPTTSQSPSTYPPNPVGLLKSDSLNPNQSLPPPGRLKPIDPSSGGGSDYNDLPLTSDRSSTSTIVTQTAQVVSSVQSLPPADQSLSQVQSNIGPSSQNDQTSLPHSQSQSQIIPTAEHKLSPSLNLNQPPQMLSQQSQNLTQPQSNSQPFPGSFPVTSGPPRSQNQNIFAPPTTNPPTSQNTSGFPPQPQFSNTQNLFGSTQNLQPGPHSVLGATQNVTSNTQNLFGSSQPPQFPAQNQVLSGPHNLSGPQTQYPLQPKLQSQVPKQYPDQQNLFGSQPNLTGPTSGPMQLSQNIYSSQQNLASQRKYPTAAYGTQQPVATTNISGPSSGPQRPAVPPSGPVAPGQYQPRPLQPGMPPLPGQQAQNQYGMQPQYPGQMSNVPLDNMPKRYPGSYPDQMNQLNNQMSGMSVAHSGFDKLWGTESIDLMQCRNVLPTEKVEPPRIKLQQEFLESVNCSPDIFRCTLTKIPETNSLLQKSRLPLGVLIHPFKDLNHLPVIQCSTIVRCRACRTYINPYVYFVDSKRWKCNLCYRVNELPEEFQFDPVTKSYGDPSRRPEVKTSTIEFIAPSEYMLRPPQPAVYLFVLDVSRLAVESGYLGVVCNTIADELSRLPGDGRTQVGFLAVDSALHFYSMPDNVSQPHELVMLDVDDVFLPCPDNLIVNLKEREELVRDLLAQLPTKFQGTHDTNNALGAGLQAAFKLVSPTGGRVSVFQTCLPNLGPGSLQSREDPNNRSGKEVPHLNPSTDFYKRLALDCSGQQIAVDLFLLNSQYSDLATLSGMCKFSGGCIYHLPLFRVNKPQHTDVFERMLRRYLTRKIGFEAVMRIRCTRGLSIHTFHGNFFVRSTDLLSLPNVNPDAGFGMQVAIEENLSDVQSVCFQAALLYTSSKGERRIRVHTLCLPVASNLSDILHSADQQCIVGLLSKMAVDRSQQSSLSDARDALINVAIDALTAYKITQSNGPGGLLAPENLKLLPMYIIALLKFIAFRSGTSTRLDDRVFAMCQMKAMPLSQLIQNVYPDLYPIHALDDQNSKDIDGKICPQPPRLHLSAEKLDSRGAFLLDLGDKILIYIGKNIHPTFCTNVLGVPAFASIPEEMYDLPELDTIESERVRNFVFSLQEEKPYYASLQIVRDDSHFRQIFTERLIEDRIESALSYYEFLQHLKTQVK